jgi:hypothetical protein
MRPLHPRILVLPCTLLSTLPSSGGAEEPPAPSATDEVQALLDEGRAGRESKVEPALLLELVELAAENLAERLGGVAGRRLTLPVHQRLTVLRLTPVRSATQPSLSFRSSSPRSRACLSSRSVSSLPTPRVHVRPLSPMSLEREDNPCSPEASRRSET